MSVLLPAALADSAWAICWLLSVCTRAWDLHARCLCIRAPASVGPLGELFVICQHLLTRVTHHTCAGTVPAPLALLLGSTQMASQLGAYDAAACLHGRCCKVTCRSSAEVARCCLISRVRTTSSRQKRPSGRRGSPSAAALWRRRRVSALDRAKSCPALSSVLCREREREACRLALGSPWGLVDLVDPTAPHLGAGRRCTLGLSRTGDASTSSATSTSISTSSSHVLVLPGARHRLQRPARPPRVRTTHGRRKLMPNRTKGGWSRQV